MGSTTKTFDGRVALVTGGGRGIGRAVALGLSAAGARVAVMARSADEVEHTARLVGERGGVALGVPSDVADPAQLSAAVQTIRDQWGPVEILVNNAGVVFPVGGTSTVDLDQWATAQAINVTAPVRLSMLLLPAMLEAGWGRIVNVSSGIVANPAGMMRANAYVTSKSALEAHTLNLAAEVADTGVTVNVYRPGGVDTAMQAFIRDQDPQTVGFALHERFVKNHEQGSLLTPEQSAASLLARLSGEETGQIWDASDPLPAVSMATTPSLS